MLFTIYRSFRIFHFCIIYYLFFLSHLVTVPCAVRFISQNLVHHFHCSIYFTLFMEVLIVKCSCGTAYCCNCILKNFTRVQFTWLSSCHLFRVILLFFHIFCLLILFAFSCHCTQTSFKVDKSYHSYHLLHLYHMFCNSILCSLFKF